MLGGGRGADTINARDDSTVNPGTDTVRGGGGRDFILANDGFPNMIDCGPARDTVFYDQALDTVSNCEDKRPS